MKPSQNAKIGAVLLGLVLLTTLKHSAFSYLEITPVKFGYVFLDWLYSIVVVLVLDAAILYASYRGRIDLARIAAFTVGALSLAAFWSVEGEFSLTQWVAVVAFSVIIPYLQYELAEIFAADLHRADDYLLRGARIEELERERDQAVNRIAVLEQARAQSDSRLETIRAELASLRKENEEVWARNEELKNAQQEQAGEISEAIADRDRIIREQDAAKEEYEARLARLIGERDALKTDLLTMTGARDEAVRSRDQWEDAARTLGQYQPLHYALKHGPVTLGRNQILVPERFVAKDGLVLPFRIANNNDPALKKIGEDFAD